LDASIAETAQAGSIEQAGAGGHDDGTGFAHQHTVAAVEKDGAWNRTRRLAESAVLAARS